MCSCMRSTWRHEEAGLTNGSEVFVCGAFKLLSLPDTVMNKDERVEPGRGTGRRHRTRVTRSELKPLARIARGGSTLDRYPQRDIRESLSGEKPLPSHGAFTGSALARTFTRSLYAKRCYMLIILMYCFAMFSVVV